MASRTHCPLMESPKNVEFTIIIRDIVHALKCKSMDRDERTINAENFTSEACCSSRQCFHLNDEANGSSHHNIVE
jgi:hypothetical protein